MAPKTPLAVTVQTGVVKTTTPHSVQDRWIDAQHMRFEGGKPAKIGGWKRASEDFMDGVARGGLGWMTYSGQLAFTIGTWRKLYTLLGGSLADITPFRESGTLATDPFAVTEDDPIVTVTDSNHGLIKDAIVHFSGATAGGGVTIDGTYTVVEVLGPNAYTIDISPAVPTSTDSATGGGAVAYEYEINPGLTSQTLGLGWGAGSWSEGTWGTPRTEGIVLSLRYWFIQKYNTNIMVLPSGGRIYYWDQSNGDPRAELLTNSPSALGMFVTAENYIVALGTEGNNMEIRWPTRDDPTVWTPAVGNDANIRGLQAGNVLIAGTAVGDAQNLIWSDTAVYFHQYTGAPSSAMYSTRIASLNAGLLGPGAFATAGGRCFWMSPTKFMMYDGSIGDVPRQEEVREWVYGRLFRTQASKTWASFHPTKNEIWFGYCADGDIEPNDIVILNLADFSWTPTKLRRTVMGYYPNPTSGVVMGGADSLIYDHEVGLDDADGGAIEAYIHAGLLALQGGIQDIEVWRYVVDHERQKGPVDLFLATRQRPDYRSPVLETHTATILDTEYEADFQITGRHLEMKITTNSAGGDLKLGTPFLETGGGGLR